MNDERRADLRDRLADEVQGVGTTRADEILAVLESEGAFDHAADVRQAYMQIREAQDTANSMGVTSASARSRRDSILDLLEEARANLAVNPDDE